MDLLASRTRTARRHRRPSTAAWWVHLIGALALVAGLFLPLATAGTLANPADTARMLGLQSGDGPVPPAPQQVTAVGDFQSQLGCADFDPSCQTTQLTSHNGIWTGVFAVPPGTYSWQIQAIAPDGTLTTYGQGGLDGGAEQVTVGDGDAGLYFRLNPRTNDAEAAAVSALYSIDINGTGVALEPDGGQLSALYSSDGGGSASVQVYAGADPVGGPQQADLAPGPNRLTFATDGTLVNVQPLQGATLTIERLDAAGNPLPGGCYQLVSGGSLVNQACDADTGADGYTVMTFPEGIPGGSVTLVEASAPDGAEPVDDQSLQLEPGDLFVTLQPEAVAEPTEEEITAPTEAVTEEPTEDVDGQVIEGDGEATEEATEAVDAAPGDLLVYLTDANGAPIGGACFELVQDGAVVLERCDREPDDSAEFADNGTTGFFGVPSGEYTLRLSDAPEGVSAPEQPVEVIADQTVEAFVTAEVAVEETPEPTATLEPTEAPEPTETAVPQPANLTITLLDQNTQPVGGACWQLVRDGQVVAESCDTEAGESAEFANNGNAGFFEIEPGTYTLVMSAAPEGVDPVEDRQIDVAPGSDDVVTVQATVAEPTVAPTEAPEPTATIVPTEVAEPTETVVPTDVVEPTEVATEPAAPGNLTVTLLDQNGEPIGGACWQLLDGETVVDESCDTLEGESEQFANNGNAGFFDVPAGTYTLRLLSGPEGVSVDDREVTVEAGIEVIETITATVAPTEEPTEAATEAPTEAATEAATQPDEPGPPGNLIVELRDANDAPIGGACFEIAMAGEAPIERCDSDDAFPGNGRTGFFGVPSGTYTLTQSVVPQGTEAIEPREVTIEPGDNPELVVTAPEGEPDATEPAEAPETPDDGQGGQDGGTVRVDVSALGSGVCIQLDTASGIGFANPPAACDDGEGDENPQPGIIELRGLEPGTYLLSVTSGADGVDPQEVEVSAEGPTEITLGAAPEPTATLAPEPTATEAPTTGILQVEIESEAGEALPGGCVAVDGGEAVCDDTDGEIVIEEVPAGEHTVAQTSAPEGFEPTTGEQRVAVEPGETTAVIFENRPATGAIVVTVVDANGAVVPGLCVTAATQAAGIEPVTSCEQTADGTYRLEGLVPGNWEVTLGQVPEQYTQPDVESVAVGAGAEAQVEFVLNDAPPQTGSAQLSLLTEDGQAAVGVCVVLTNVNTGEALGPFCDQGDADGDATEGVLLIQGLPEGTYGITFPDHDDVAPQGDTPPTIAITAGEATALEVIVPGLFAYGSIEVRTVDATTGDPVPGACYTVSTDPLTEVCDDGAGDESAEAGTVLITALAPGDYTVSLSQVPDGYSGAADQNVTVTGGQTASLSFELEAEATTGSLTVAKRDGAGAALPGACFRLQTADGTVVGRACDATDGTDDGSIVFGEVPAGTYRLVETRTPSGYQTAPARDVTITAGEATEIEVVNTTAPGRLHVIKVDAADPSVRLEGACFELQGETTYGPFCDADDRDEDGRIIFAGVTPGTYTLVETEAPSGYDAAADREVTIRAGVTLQVTVENRETPPPPEAGTLVVNKLGPDQNALAGGCFRLFDGDTPVTGQVCDITDGTNDGRIVFEDVPAGTWTLRETLAPSPSYRLAPDQQVTIEDDETTEVDVVNQFKNGRILVKKVTPKGHPIPGACFELQPDQGDPLCSDADGEILFENLPVGTYTLVETVTPYGFREAEPVEDIQVRPAQTTVVTVENERQPPPNTGSVQVLKFVCPVDSADEERTAFLGGAAGNAELAQTKGCVQADAGFTLVGEDGSDGPGAFRTGGDGQYQVTLPAKIYRLDETDPDLPGNSAALLRVEVGRLTTVVVINYIAPPEPEPVDIHVTKYTCQAGFNGTTFADFAESCMQSTQLTNNITVRAEGETSLKAVTGDGGQVGRTVFADQPAGTYTIYEERPYNIPTNYQFCGWDANWPADYKAINGAITVELGEGADLHCVMFNIPEPVTDSTGVILVRKYVCDVDAPPKGYDFETECRISDQQAAFELKRFNEEMQDYGDAVQQTANPDGILRFVDLRPGSFQLREVGGNWCYANSNSVNSKGDVVVKAGQVSLVSIYNCVGASEPPNTGSGDAAGLLAEPDTPAPGEPRETPGLAWPLAAIAAVVFALRPRKVLAPGHDWRLDEPIEDDRAA